MAPRPGDGHVYSPPPPPAPTTTAPPYWDQNGPAIGGYTWGTYKSKSYTPGEDLPDTTYFVIGVGGTTTATFLGWAPYPTTVLSTTPLAEYTPQVTSAIATKKPWRGQNDYPPPNHTSQAMSAIAGAVTALVVVGLALLCCFLFWRRKKRQRKQVAVQMAERNRDSGTAFASNSRVKTISAHIADPADTRSYIRPPTSPPPAVLASSSSSSVPSTSHQEQPVILSRTMDQSYYTGIDTSDHISIADNRSHNSAVYAESQDEPPPPYRPASVPPISRDNSVRFSSGFALDRNLRNSIRTAPIRSPFDDPEEEISDIEDEAPQRTNVLTPSAPSISSRASRQNSTRTTDTVSEVSELEYQREETRPHSNL